MPSATRALPERTFWIESGRMIGGAYPGDASPERARSKLEALLDVGVLAFLNLMERDETNRTGVAFAPYEPIARALATPRGVALEFGRLEIVDQSTPSVARMREILAWLDDRLARGHLCYVHCWGGRGRTGTVAGIHLIRSGLATPANFMDVIRELRGSDVERDPAPENSRQRDFVRRFPGITT
jgi:protein-tyrosine phosphatase